MKNKVDKLQDEVAKIEKKYQKLLKELEEAEYENIQEKLAKIGKNCIFYEVRSHPTVLFLVIKDFRLATITEDVQELRWEKYHKNYGQCWMDIIFNTSRSSVAKYDPKITKVSPTFLLTHENKYLRALAKETLSNSFHKLS